MLLHRFHGNLQHIARRIEMRGVYLLAVQKDFQLAEISQMLHIHEQRLYMSLAFKLIFGSLHRTNESKRVVGLHLHSRRAFQTNLVERHPGSFQDSERNLIAALMKNAWRKGNLQQPLILRSDVALDYSVCPIRHLVIGNGIVDRDLEHRPAPEHSRQINRKQSLILLPNFLECEKDVQHLCPASCCMRRACPIVVGAGKDVWEILLGVGMSHEEITVLVSEVSADEVFVTCGCQRELTRRVVVFSNLPYHMLLCPNRCGTKHHQSHQKLFHISSVTRFIGL